MAKKPEPRIVEAVGIASSVAGGKKSDLAKRVEGAMSHAVHVARANGITKPEEIRAAMMEARQKVLDAARAPVKKEA